MTAIPALIEKLRGLKGPDREVDIAIVKALYPFIGECSPLCADDEPIFWREPFYKQPCPPLTASLDATASLIERELPGYSWGARKMINGLGFATITRTDSYHDWFHGCCSFCRTATAETPTLALLLAFLEAKMEIEE